jgi:hypothetical protein
MIFRIMGCLDVVAIQPTPVGSRISYPTPGILCRKVATFPCPFPPVLQPRHILKSLSLFEGAERPIPQQANALPRILQINSKVEHMRPLQRLVDLPQPFCREHDTLHARKQRIGRNDRQGPLV